MKYTWIIFILLFVNGYVVAKPHYTFTPALRTAYSNILSLRLKEGTVQLNQIKKSDPENLMVWFVEDYIDFLVIFINENEAEFEKLQSNMDIRLSKLQKGDPASPYFLYTQAEVRLHWAILSTKFGGYITAFNGVSKGYGLLEQNQKKFPNFMANKKSLGAMHALVGTIPDNYKWGVRLLSGLNGTIAQGMKEIEDVVQYAKKNPDFEFKDEVMVEYAFLVLHLNSQGESAWNLINNGTLNPKQSMLACFALANVAMRTGHNDKAIELLQNAPNGAAYHPFLYLKFMLGAAKLYRIDADADQPILQFVSQFKGRFSIKEAYMKLAWHSLLQGNNADYQKYITLCKSKGTNVSGPDKNAMKEASSGTTPDLVLLKARIQFDGGYYQQAYNTLMTRSAASYKNKKQQLEYTYRLGRILHKQKKYTEALEAYQATLEEGSNDPAYFACNAALQAGEIYELSLKQYANAKVYYQKCLALNPEDYAESLHAKAKAGLNRMKK